MTARVINLRKAARMLRAADCVAPVSSTALPREAIDAATEKMKELNVHQTSDQSPKS